MRRTIANWYANAEGRNSADFRQDWENDDRPDRTPDTWLDRLKPSERPAAARPSGRSAPASRRSSPGRVPTQRDLADAARELQARMRGIKDTTIARHLRQSGWSHVSAEQVRQALRSHPARSNAQSQRPVTVPPTPATAPQSTTTRTKSGGTITVIFPPTNPPPPTKKSKGKITVTASPTAKRKQTRASTPAHERPPLAEVIRAVQARHPGLGIKLLVQEVRAGGWPAATRKEVEAARQSLLSTPPPRTPATLKAQASASSLRTARAPHPDACFACGVVPSPLGTCRCS
ncbi:hypothetical protein K7640_01365 [Micromonospora sp. PLK6-60]|uniref:hypothetical protein n=1 Tax=Micromonospora sp. PLK6-60 TaxID=2873383 RepID=UPI001CA69EE9|nr:hypothetical protein [Micromonospora sp. PLK6-60]MBY8870488.1 hypothetical protein [Micromonospora sp. PLK6-60]